MGRRTTRREFLRELGCGTLTATAVMTGAEHLFLMNRLATPAAAADYKALVCIFLFGGNDANNLVVPVDNYAAYAAVRGDLTIPQDQLLPISPASAGAAFGFHPNLARLQQLWTQQRLAVVANVGPLIAPLTRATYQSTPSLRPYQLYSHSDQSDEWQTAYANGPTATGWGGRAADLLQDASGFPLITSLAGVTVFSAGTSTSPLTLPPAPTPLNQGLGLKRAADRASGSPLRQILDLALGGGAPTLVTEAADINSRAIAASLALSTDPTIATVFPSTQLGNQLKQVAKLIKVASTGLGLSRQIFFCSLGGFDTHSDQGTTAGAQPDLLKTLNDAMGAFYDATVELALAGSVTTFTMSDFSRTLAPDGTGAATGTDHAWGAHHLVMGDAVDGGDFYGTFPTLACDGPDDADSGTGARGRWIPTTAVDQYGATLAKWFGVGVSSLPTVFPNIGRFPTSNLGFML